MEIKKIKNYSKKELQDLLKHWFYYYGKELYSKEEEQVFFSMIEDHPENMMRTAAILYGEEIGPRIILKAIRGNTKELEEILIQSKTLSEFELAKIEKTFVEEVVTTYNNPESEAAFSPDAFINQLASLLGCSKDDFTVIDVNKVLNQKKSKIDRKRLSAIIYDVLFRNEEIVDGEPNAKYLSAKINEDQVVFHAERLKKYRSEILDIVNELPLFDKPLNVSKLAVDKDGNKWAYDSKDLKNLVSLAVSCDYLEILDYEDGTPIIAKVKNPKKRLVGTDPSKLDCFKNAIRNGKNMTSIEIAKRAYELSVNDSKELLKEMGYEIKFNDEKVFFYNEKLDLLLEAELEIDSNRVSFTSNEGGKEISYSIHYDGRNKDNKLLHTTTVTIDALKEDENGLADGNYISIDIGNDSKDTEKSHGLDILLIDPKALEKCIDFQVSERNFGLRVCSEVDLDEKIKEKDRYLYYINPKEADEASTLIMSEIHKDSEVFNILIDDEEPKKYTHRTRRISASNKDLNAETNEAIQSIEEVNRLTLEYLKTSRSKNLYNFILAKMEEFLPSIREYLREHYDLLSYIECVMSTNANEEIEAFINKNKVKEANILGEEPKGPRRKRK